MASHLRPSRSKARPLGVLAIAVGVALVVLVGVDRRSDDDDVTLVRPAAERSTEPTVLGEVIERTTTLPLAPPASPATFPTSSGPSGGSGSSGGTSPTQPPGTTSPTLVPPVSITSPDPPRTTTSTTTTTSSSTTSTTAPTTTTTTEPTTTTTSADEDG